MVESQPNNNEKAARVENQPARDEEDFKAQ